MMVAPRDGGDLTAGARVVQQQRRPVRERVPVLFGKADHAEDHFEEVRVTLETTGRRRADVVFRCCDDAFALRYELPAQDGLSSVTITDETTSFAIRGRPDGLRAVSRALPDLA
jgi:hypothetical protein